VLAVGELAMTVGHNQIGPAVIDRVRRKSSSSASDQERAGSAPVSNSNVLAESGVEKLVQPGGRGGSAVRVRSAHALRVAEDQLAALWASMIRAETTAAALFPVRPR
jgi:hypothetical protein